MNRLWLGLGCATLLAVAAAPTAMLAGDRDQYGARRDARDDDKDPDDRAGDAGWSFRRIATFANFRNAGLDNATVSEIVASTPDGKILVYTDAEQGALGFVDISDPSSPVAAGTVALDGATGPASSPTSVAVLRNQYVLVAVDTSASKKQASGELQVIDLATRAKVATLDLGGQPDSVKISPDHRYVAVAVENERDEALCVGGAANDRAVSDSTCTAGGGRLGGMPQDQLGNPAGYLSVIETAGPPVSWTRHDVALTGLAGARFPSDPEPEFVDVNERNQAVVTLQENNHVVVVDLPTRTIVSHFSAGAVDLAAIDAVRAGSGLPNTIALTSSQAGRLREPDAVAWVGWRIATANEGDYDGGSRGFTIFNLDGSVFHDSGNELEHLAVRAGHYPDRRSNSKGVEPEGILFERFGDDRALFVGAERGSFIAVYLLDKQGRPRFSQLLPGPLGPEGLLAIPNRGLFVASGENDAPPYGVRSNMQIYALRRGAPAYPQVASFDELVNGSGPTPIPWSALSGLTEVPGRPGTLQAVWDSFFTPTRIFTIDVTRRPAMITGALTVGAPCTTAAGCYDPEGLAYAPDGDLWIASEGNADDTRPNRLIQVDPATGAVLRTVGLPSQVLACRAAERAKSPASTRATGSHGSGFEGLDIVAKPGGGYLIYAAQQRGWNYATTPACDAIDDDPADGGSIAEPNQTRLWVFDPSVADNDRAWSWVPYHFQPRPENASWIGLSEITYTPDGWILIERDNLTGSFDSPAGAATPNGYKTLVRVPLSPGADQQYTRDEKQIVDLRPALERSGGYLTDKPEGVGILPNGQVFVVTDNDGVDGWSGETWFFGLGPVWRLFR